MSPTIRAYPARYKSDIGKLQNRCRLAGAEEAAVGKFPIVFPAGITLEALTHHRTSAEIETAQFGSGGGPVYLALLKQVVKAEGGGNVVAHPCHLCPNIGGVLAWKKPRCVCIILGRIILDLATAVRSGEYRHLNGNGRLTLN